MTVIQRAAATARSFSATSQLMRFAVITLVMGAAYNIVASTLNNFLDSTFSLTGFQRSFLEVPRELPGFSVVFVSALLWFLCSRRLGIFALMVGAVGAVLLGFLSTSYAIMTVWLFIYSLGDHLVIPVATTIGMELAEEGKTGARLGQLNSLRNLAAILGSFLVFLGFRYLDFNFQTTFLIAGILLALAAAIMATMPRSKPKPAGDFLRLHGEYRLYYILAVLAGARKQLFITFAPWVLVTIFKQPTQLLATLLTISGVIGVLFQPLLGRTIDWLGERFVLASEAVALVFVCAGYGFSLSLFPEATAFLVVCACFLLDQMLYSVGMARSTYMKKIALDPAHIQPTLTMGLSIDHIFSISAALIGGLIWNQFGYQYVFLMGAGIAVLNFFFALRIRLPKVSLPAALPPEVPPAAALSD